MLHSLKPVIEARELGTHYVASTPVLQGIDLTIGASERVALIGPNGSGKSTLLKCLVGLQSPATGTVTTFSQQFSTLPGNSQRAAIRSRTGFVFQQHCLVRRRSALTNVIHGLFGQAGGWRAFHQVTAPQEWRHRAMEALAEVNLSEKASQRCDELSGGQQQRVAIARALVRRPDLLIADEPAASLDPTAGHEVMQLFSQRCLQKKITLLFTTHDMVHAKSFADRIIALKEGRILLDAPAEQISEQALSQVFNG